MPGGPEASAVTGLQTDLMRATEMGELKTRFYCPDWASLDIF